MSISVRRKFRRRADESTICVVKSSALIEREADELHVDIQDPKTWRAALQGVCRVLKGWQEEADPGSERRGWRWLLEADTDANGYDHTGAPVSLWGLVRVSLERGGIGEPDKGEDLDLEGFGVRIWGEATVDKR